MPLTATQMDAATRWNAANASKLGWTVRPVPGSGLPARFSGPGDPLLAQYVYDLQLAQSNGVRADGKLGPKTLALMQGLVKHAVQTGGDANTRATHPGWFIFNYLGLPSAILAGATPIAPVAPPGQALAPTPAAGAPAAAAPTPAAPAPAPKKKKSFLAKYGAYLAVGGVLALAAAVVYSRKGRRR